MTKIEAIKLAVNMQYQRLWNEDEIDALRDLCEESNINADFGLIYDAYFGRSAEDSADLELDRIADALAG